MPTPGASISAPPPGGDRSRGFQDIAVHAILLGISTTLLSLRLYTRSVIVKNIGLDDYLIAIGVVSDTPFLHLPTHYQCSLSMQLWSIAGLIITVFMVRNGIGRHIYYLLRDPHTLQQLCEATKLQYIHEVVMIFGAMFVKVSVGFFLLRIFALGTERWWKWALYSIIVFYVLNSLSSAIIVLTECRPSDEIWSPLALGSCWGPGTVVATGYSNGGNCPPPFWHTKGVAWLYFR